MDITQYFPTLATLFIGIYISYGNQSKNRNKILNKIIGFSISLITFIITFIRFGFGIFIIYLVFHIVAVLISKYSIEAKRRRIFFKTLHILINESLTNEQKLILNVLNNIRRTKSFNKSSLSGISTEEKLKLRSMLHYETIPIEYRAGTSNFMIMYYNLYKNLGVEADLCMVLSYLDFIDFPRRKTL